MNTLLQIKLRQALKQIDQDTTLNSNQKSLRKEDLVLKYRLSNTASTSLPNNGPSALPGFSGPPLLNSVAPQRSSLMSPHAQSFYPPADTVESVVGKKRTCSSSLINAEEISLSCEMLG